MNNIFRDIETGLSFLRGNNSQTCGFGYGSTFVVTNEELGSYYKYFPIKDGKVLTIAASGDHILQAICNGALEVYGFDYNAFAIYMSKLKVGALKALDREDFMGYFYNYINHFKNDRYLCVDIYNKFKECLDADTRKFWDAMYNRGFFDKKHMNITVESLKVYNIGEDSYISEDNYYKTKENLKKASIFYYHSSFYNILNKIPDDVNFDAIFLSNIYDWFFRMEEVNNYPLFINNELCKRLTDKGMIAVYAPANGFDKGGDVLEQRYSHYINTCDNNKVIFTKKKVLSKV